jgi:hypothetical protein
MKPLSPLAEGMERTVRSYLDRDLGNRRTDEASA